MIRNSSFNNNLGATRISKTSESLYDIVIDLSSEEESNDEKAQTIVKLN